MIYPFSQSKTWRVLLGTLLAALPLLGHVARADEGMWTFDNPPTQQLKSKYNFVPTQAWLDHLRLSCVRLSDGGSGSFVSPNGLVLTNHHVANEQLQNISNAQKDYFKDGLYARTEAEEIKCPSLEMNVLVSMENVTRQVLRAAQGKDAAAGLKARDAETARLTRESQAATGLKSQVVSLYLGGEYWLYRYKRYTDIRLVFAPEEQIAFFGGDPDNFTYPRYDLDFALFRVYDNGKPLQSKDYLTWNSRGATDGDLVFVVGHPGHTNRLGTLTELLLQRDTTDPIVLTLLRRGIAVIKEYAAQGPEQARQVAGERFGMENELKRDVGSDTDLQDAGLIAKKRTEETALRSRVSANPEWERKYGAAWDRIGDAAGKFRALFKRLIFRNLGGPGSPSTLVRYVAEVQKPDGERLPGFHDAQLTSLRFSLLAPVPVYPALEEREMAERFTEAQEYLGPGDPWVKAVLNGRTPAQAAHALIAGTKLADPAVRKALLTGGAAAVAASTDPLIVLARRLDPMARALDKREREEIESVLTPAGEKIGQARFAAYGKSTYPDATFTLRLAYGPVTGYPMNGTRAPAKTTFYGLYDRANGFNFQPPFDLPARWAGGAGKLDLTTPLNFVCACDIIGGNSGSPVVNRSGELVGLIFDGNIESLAGDYVYNGTKNRAVAVCSSAIIEALRKLYEAGPLADEMEGKNR